MDANYICPSKWTHTGSKVLILKCVNADRTSHNGFLWPETGPVRPEKPELWDDKPECGHGALYGWPWGFGVGDGKEANYQTDLWILFEADPENVVQIGDKCKAKEGSVVFCGSYIGAMIKLIDGRTALIQRNASGAASATGARGAASATGESGAASATGARGAASATGWSGAASATGERGAASATGARGAASATDWSGAASATGWRGIAALSGTLGTIEVSGKALGAVTADVFFWKVRDGATVVQKTERGVFLLTANDFGADGELVKIEHGVKIQ